MDYEGWPKGREPLIWEEEFARREQEEREAEEFTKLQEEVADDEQEQGELVRRSKRIPLAARRQQQVPMHDPSFASWVIQQQRTLQALRQEAIRQLLAAREEIDLKLERLGYKKS